MAPSRPPAMTRPLLTAKTILTHRRLKSWRGEGQRRRAPEQNSPRLTAVARLSMYACTSAPMIPEKRLRKQSEYHCDGEEVSLSLRRRGVQLT